MLLVAGISGVAAAALAAWGGAQIAGLLPGNARTFLVAMALGLAGTELIFRAPRPAPTEPTHSLGAFALVLFAIQLTDAARFLVFALAALTRAPVTTGMGGALGAILVVAAGWIMLLPLKARWLTGLRRGLGGLSALLALVLAVQVLAAR